MQDDLALLVREREHRQTKVPGGAHRAYPCLEVLVRPIVYPEFMKVDLTADQRAFVHKAIESGRFTSEQQAVEEALALWEERERRRLELLTLLDEADASLARGDGIPITEASMKTLADNIKQRGRDRLATEPTKSR